MEQTQQSPLRRYLVGWLYTVAAGHLFGGVLLVWLGDSPLLSGYHQSIEQAFWGNDIPTAAHGMQVWWLALLGATVQSYALFLIALVHLGNRYRSSAAWGWLMVGLLVWAPQDMLVSLQVGIWSHVWIDSFALLCLLPPLAWLYRNDRQSKTPSHA